MVMQQEILLPESGDAAKELAAHEARIEQIRRSAFVDFGLELRAIQQARLYRGRYQTFEDYYEQRWEIEPRHAYRLMDAADAVKALQNLSNWTHLPTAESHVRPLLKLTSDDERASAWAAAVDRTGGKIRAADVEAEVARIESARRRDWITKPEWLALDTDERRAALAVRNPGASFNKQDNESIEWAQWSWNPVTGCLHDCPYCYARDIAQRFYNQGFEPSFYPARLAAPAQVNVPGKAASDIAYRNVFTCSMADLFGRWVPREWIEAVLAEVRANPQWNFLFLTKFPKRLAEFEIPTNAWMGTTVDLQARVNAAEQAFGAFDCGVKWLSIEPLLEPLKFARLDLFDWIVIGGSSRSTATPAWVPPLDWMVDLHVQARAAGCRIYYKTNAGMSDELRLREFPWGERPLEKTLPSALKYLGRDKDRGIDQ